MLARIQHSRRNGEGISNVIVLLLTGKGHDCRVMYFAGCSVPHRPIPFGLIATARVW